MDFGTDSVRAVLIDALGGRELANEVAYYRRWAAGKYCDPAKNRFRQHPLDYIEGMEAAVKGALAKLGKRAGQGRCRHRHRHHRLHPLRRGPRGGPPRPHEGVRGKSRTPCSSCGRTTPR